MNEPKRAEARPLFARLEPPPGGLADLRRRIAAEEAAQARLRGWRWAVGGLATAAAVVALALLSTRPPAPTWVDAPALAGDPGLVALGRGPAPREPVTLAPDAGPGAALRRVETATPGVVYYRVMAAPAGEP